MLHDGRDVLPHDGEHLVAREASTGQPPWQVPPKERVPDEVMGRRVETVDRREIQLGIGPGEEEGVAIWTTVLPVQSSPNRHVVEVAPEKRFVTGVVRRAPASGDRANGHPARGGEVPQGATVGRLGPERLPAELATETALM